MATQPNAQQRRPLDTQLVVRVSGAEREALEAVALAEDRSIGAVVRLAVRRELAGREAQQQERS